MSDYIKNFHRGVFDPEKYMVKQLDKQFIQDRPCRNNIFYEIKREILKEGESIQKQCWKIVDKLYEHDNQSVKDKKFLKLFRKKVKETFKGRENKFISWDAEKLRKVINCVSYGILFVDRNVKEILVVQNNHGTYSAAKGHYEWDNSKLESQWETAKREASEELLIKPIVTNQPNPVENVDQQIRLESLKYREYVLTDDRLIGLFIVSIDKEKYHFYIRDKNENQGCEWLNVYKIPNPTNGTHDPYYTLRPFIE